ncbi:1-acyl-sn-glycerol-3-phosphate acyltransferase PLS1 [Thecamonas trahens ATCC 50062]|uniref:1-acyl-sn-glycerol-3-phosphate acyltransferase PLS1 n=1 Tax=Thecamonas trahens ATCC 50062 TaxID=461836 RepID=A0A0L0DDR9_THETB|nr:1-acyl-sn-glycerol-3-phosphate acyltransferase PLS1 [Thecamonas trahens ATCC 50062]KNC50281.1 1-acyl-sn-glycerol-3-phosphate acyltransferase PLS1 [Thecamonas trahens ATCC 50062]|eukprot:XP_013757108.1 1-acyl-sn-glycerol-3-phosphate acyltransferase PLS1 [Thecamonas trahens ATCC 50062]
MGMLYKAAGLCLWSLIWIEAIVMAIVTFTIVSPLSWLLGGRIGHARTLNAMVDRLIWYHMVWMLEVWGGSRIEFYGDELPLRESALLISNHIFLADFWPFFSLALRKGRLGCIKIFSKNNVKYLPGFGWGAWLMGFVFIRRNWTQDADLIRNTFANLKATGLPIWLLSHPESTRITPRKYAESVAYQKQNSHLPALKHLLLPRTRGFIATVDALRDSLLDSVYDLTVDYPEGFPGMFNTAAGNGPRIVIHIKRYPIEELPRDADELKAWCLERWVEKDALLETFRTTDAFPDPIPEPFARLPMNL